jgi:metal-sulfur cluster biosynthetic enzyme
MFIQTETMPDPARLKFLPGREVLPSGSIELRDREQAARSPLAERLFAIPDIAGVAFSRDAITVTKAGGDWQRLKPAILGAIMEHFTSGAPVLRTAAGDHAAADGADQVREALRQVIDPELGYNIVDLGLIYGVVAEDGDVRIAMTTTTPGCPATSYLQNGAREAASGVPGVASVEVTLTYEPRWTPELMSAEAKARFGITDGGSR